MQVARIGRKLISPIAEFIRDSRAVGITLVCCTIVSLTITNSAWGEGYLQFWETDLTMPAPSLHLPHTLLHLINDALMAVFFFLVGLEIKRELMIGELSSVKRALLPVIAALGGMLVPALIYLLWCGGTPFSRGWGVPMATDIAFSLGVLSLLGKRAPVSLRIFLTALAIIDDLGGILTIAIFYAGEIEWSYLLMGGGLLFVLALLNIFKVRLYFIYLLFGVFLWYCVFNSGVHPTIAGVLLALTIPLHKIDALEHALHDPVNFIIMPVFALANTAIVLPSDYNAIFASPVSWGIIAGLVLGKPIGIVLFSWLGVKLKFAALPGGLSWKEVTGMGMIAGIGFTISIFMATLAFAEEEVQVIAKVAIMVASVVAGLLGFLYLRGLARHVNRV